MRIAVLGATGLTGLETIRLLLAHPTFEPTLLTSSTRAGTPIADIHPSLRERTDLVLEPFHPRLGDRVDAVVSCLPHKASMQSINELLAHRPDLKIVDLSGDFRFPDAAAYETVYGIEHVAPELVAEAAYGLPEWFADEIVEARLVANPGCYPTASILALAPLVQAGILKAAIVDAKSGLSGAGATPNDTTHFVNANESVRAYKAFDHRHGPEIDAQLGRIHSSTPNVLFQPHLVPMDVGIFATAYATTDGSLDGDAIAALYEEAYANAPFVRLLKPGAIPDTKNVARTNLAEISIATQPGNERVIVFSAIDNTLKGASGQAIQNLNLLFNRPQHEGFPEALGCHHPIQPDSIHATQTTVPPA